MKKFLVVASIALAAIVSSARPAQAASILYFSDFAVGTDRMAAALAALAGTHTTTTAANLAAFTASATGGGFDIVILQQQNFATDGSWNAAWAAVAAHIASGGAAIGDNWTQNPANTAAFGTGFTGTSPNQTSVTISDPGLLVGIVNPVLLLNPGWGIFSYGLAPTTAACGATFGNGQCAIAIGFGGRTFFNGMLNDTFADGAEGVQLYINEINAAAQAAVPEPATIGLIGAGLAYAVRRRRNRA